MAVESARRSQWVYHVLRKCVAGCWIAEKKAENSGTHKPESNVAHEGGTQCRTKSGTWMVFESFQVENSDCCRTMILLKIVQY